MKRFIAAVTAACFCIAPAAAELAPTAVEAAAPAVSAAAVLLMEQETGTVLYEENADTPMEPASVTKIMTLLLVMEAIDRGELALTDSISISANAAGMGGSQVYLKQGETMTVDELLKALAVVSANDAAVAFAERLAGSETSFVDLMNQRASELGMENTTFINCTGLPAAGHLTTARDIAMMSRALLEHDAILNYSTLWIDSLRDGAFQLVNTNRLVRYYEGATGLKTGFTDTAHFCLSASAQRDGMGLIAVVLGSPSSDDRFNAARMMLDYGFANYTMLDVYPTQAIAPVDVLLGVTQTVQPELAEPARILVCRAEKDLVTTELTLAQNVEAPVEAGQTLGELVIRVDGVTRQTIPIVAASSVDRLTVPGIFQNLLKSLFMS